MLALGSNCLVRPCIRSEETMNDQDHNAEIAQLQSWLAADKAEIEALRTSLAHWKVFAEHAEGEHAAWKKTGTELYDEVRRLHIAIARAVPAMHSYASKNPKHHMNGALQDPCGVHAWLADFGA